MVAFLNIGGQEMLVLLVIGLLIFGRRLPEVGRSLGRTLGQLRRGLQEFKDQMERDEDIREIKTTVRDLERELRAPRVLTDPGGMLRNLTDEALATPGPESPAPKAGGQAAGEGPSPGEAKGPSSPGGA